MLKYRQIGGFMGWMSILGLCTGIWGNDPQKAAILIGYDLITTLQEQSKQPQRTIVEVIHKHEYVEPVQIEAQVQIEEQIPESIDYETPQQVKERLKNKIWEAFELMSQCKKPYPLELRLELYKFVLRSINKIAEENAKM
jgi:hypothetical protein